MKKEKNCECKDECTCEKNCTCQQDEKHEENCECKKHECKCHEHKEKESESKQDEYLALAQRLQAEFENYRKRTFFELKKAKEDGQISVIETFLPCIDTFNVAEKSITDPKVLEGIEMIKNNILDALKKIGVEKIDAVGQKYDPNLHSALAVAKVEDKENDIVLEEYQAGYKFNDRVIRYSKVIVNKKED